MSTTRLEAKGLRHTPDSTLRSVIIAVAAAQFMLPFMMAGVGTLLPIIGTELHASAMELGLVNGVYGLSLTIFHLVSGRMGDMLGRRRLFLGGLTIFMVMTVVTPFVTDITLFLVCRFIHAMGTAMMNTCALAILTALAPPSMRGRVLALASMGLFAGISAGPALAGIIATTLGWKWLFFGLLPVGAMAWYLMATTVKMDWTNNPDKPFDWWGALFYSLAVIGLSGGATFILQGLWAMVALGAGVVLLIAFIMLQTRTAYPILDARFIFHNPIFLINALASFINNSTLMGLIFYLSLYLQGVKHLDVLHAGLVLSVSPAVQLVCTPLAGRLADRFQAAKVATLGMAIQGVGLFLASRLMPDSLAYEVTVAQIFLGVGVSLFAAPNTSAIMGSVDGAHLSQASGIVGTMRTMGMLLSMIIVSVSMNRYLGASPLNDGNIPAFMDAMHLNLNLFGALNLLAIFCSLLQLHKAFARS